MFLGCLGECTKAVRPWWFENMKLGDNGRSLQKKWIYLKETTTDRAWCGLDIPTHPNVQSIFPNSMTTNARNGRITLFWTN